MTIYLSIYIKAAMKLLAFIFEHPSYYNCFTTSSEHLMGMDFPSLSESVPMACDIDVLLQSTVGLCAC